MALVILKSNNDVPEDKKFWCVDGKAFRNLKDLSSALRKMPKGVFEYHVNDKKNDFASWTKDGMGLRKLSNDISKCKTRISVLTLLKRLHRIAPLFFYIAKYRF